jgi:hypothetical protein
LAGHKNLDNAYELVIRLFSKIPFLQYNFVADQKPMSVEQRIENEIGENLAGFHNLISENCADISEYVSALSSTVNDETIEAEIRKRLERG